MKNKIRSIVCISDTHFGCRMGLCHPEGVALDDGGLYKPSRLQKVTWLWWREFWDAWVPSVTEGESFAVVLNGDVIDGTHHGSTSQISQNILDQSRLAVDVLAPVVKQCGGQYYQTRGTEAHVGKSGVDEESIAEELGAIPDRDGKCARWNLWLRLGDHHIHFLHHVGTTGSSAHESSAVNAELNAEFVEAARWGRRRPPSVIVRSHRHRHIEVRIPTAWGSSTATVTPGWQLKTPFTWRIAGARLAPPQLGGILIRVDKYGEVYTKAFIKTIQEDDSE